MQPPEETLARCETWVGELIDKVQAVDLPRHHVAWRRDGLLSVHERMDVLKVASEQLDSLWTETTSLYSMAKVYARHFTWLEEDTIAEGLGGRVTTMVTRGMAADERRLEHQMRAIEAVSWRRRFEAVAEQLKDGQEILRVRMFRVRDERFDLHSQARLLNTAIEIGEF